MQAAKENLSQTVFIEEISVGAVETLNCPQVRDKLDDLFDGDALLEKTPAGVRRSLFRHLETCSDCCHSFDVRVRFCSAGSSRIY